MNVVIVGATSAIAHETAKLYAARGERLLLVGRDATRLDAARKDLVARGATSIDVLTYDLSDTDVHDEIARLSAEKLGSIDVVLIAHGTLPDQELCQDDFSQIQEVLNLNAISAISLCVAFSGRLFQQQSGTLAVISSVAGDRGRQSNYVYGTAKAAVTEFCSGLRGRARTHGVHVLTIKPGMVDTPMTAHLRKGPLFATPELVARDIVKAIRRRRNVLYTPYYWRFIMFVICHIPEVIFMRLRF